MEDKKEKLSDPPPYGMIYGRSDIPPIEPPPEAPPLPPRHSPSAPTEGSFVTLCYKLDDKNFF